MDGHCENAPRHGQVSMGEEVVWGQKWPRPRGFDHSYDRLRRVGVRFDGLRRQRSPMDPFQPSRLRRATHPGKIRCCIRSLKPLRWIGLLAWLLVEGIGIDEPNTLGSWVGNAARCRQSAYTGWEKSLRHVPAAGKARSLQTALQADRNEHRRPTSCWRCPLVGFWCGSNRGCGSPSSNGGGMRV